MSGFSTRFATARLEAFFDQANEALTTYAQREYQEEVDRVAEWWGGRIASSGRGGSHNSEMANIEGRVTQPRRGGFFVRLGWLNNPPIAADGRTSWFVYHDTGYDPFGMIRKGFAATRVPGLLLQVDARQRLNEGIYRANERIAARIENAARRV